MKGLGRFLTPIQACVFAIEIMEIPLESLSGSRLASGAWIYDYLRMVLARMPWGDDRLGYEEARQIVILACGAKADTDWSDERVGTRSRSPRRPRRLAPEAGDPVT